MVYYIIFIFIILITLMYFLKKKKIDNFQNYRTEFSLKNEMKGLINLPNEFSIIKMNNPGDNQYVLHQKKYDNNPVTISINIEKNKYYSLIYWITDTFKKIPDYEDDINIISNKTIINSKYKLIETKNYNNFTWKKKQFNFFSLHKKIILEIGAVNEFSEGSKYYADIQVKQFYPKLVNFEYQDKLISFYLFTINNKDIQKKFNDLTSGNSIFFNKSIITDNKGIQLNHINGNFSISSDTINSDNFSIIFSYYPKENENGSLLNIFANNDINQGVNIDIQTSINVDNKLSITIANYNYLYNIGLINNHLIIAICISSKNPTVYINGNIYREINKSIVNNISLGSCPDMWRYSNNTCTPISENKGNCKNKNFNTKKNINKAKWSNNCKIKWTNCKKLNEGEIAPKNNESCKLDTNLNFSNKKIALNQNKGLSGTLHSILIYNYELPGYKISEIYKYLISKLLKLNENTKNYTKTNDTSILHNFTDTPSLFKDRKININSINQDNNCPFNDKSICTKINCHVSDWNNREVLKNIDTQCKKVINQYCAENYIDIHCNKLRNEKKSMQSNDTTKNNNIENIENYTDFSVPEIKKIHNDSIVNCKSCNSEIDLSSYLK